MKHNAHRPLAAVLLACGWLATAATATHADLTLKGQSQLSSLNRPTRSQEALFLKDSRLRRDVTELGRSYTYLYDLRRKEMTFIDHLLRQAEVRALEAGGADGPTPARELKLQLAATGRKHDLQHWQCAEQRFSASLPGTLGQEPVTVVLDGQIWLAAGNAEQRAMAPFIEAIPAQDLFIGVPVQGRTTVTQVQGLNEVLRRILPKGMLCAAEIRIGYLGTGPMANLATRMGTQVVLAYESLSKAPIADDQFDIPKGYAVLRTKTGP